MSRLREMRQLASAEEVEAMRGNLLMLKKLIKNFALHEKIMANQGLDVEEEEIEQTDGTLQGNNPCNVKLPNLVLKILTVIIRNYLNLGAPSAHSSGPAWHPSCRASRQSDSTTTTRDTPEVQGPASRHLDRHRCCGARS